MSDCQIRRSWKETSCLVMSPVCLEVHPTVRKLSDTPDFIFIKRFSRVVCQGNFLNLLPRNPFPCLVSTGGEMFSLLARSLMEDELLWTMFGNFYSYCTPE
ncbi:hypothetical protein CEXT_597631 [Caerostris extrusa]|uniref:Uncharacterized protein n=1 Tax=Caerostris extrusa TaxID=172846 RepID=A0AAV4RNZ9_CAEEX|nr:hypothetical protein CEXT_597631 [Caerostris extrusa]